MRTRLDAIDLKILAELQSDGRMTNVELARRVGISPPPCLRRVRALENEGFITGYRAVIDERQLGFDASAYVMVGLARQKEEDLLAFEELVHTWPIVRHCAMLSGDVDFLLLCVAPSVRAIQTFVIDELTRAPNVGHVKTSLTIRRVKDDGRVPFGGAEEPV